MLACLSIWQPWATLIALGEKRCETRPRRLSYRGEIAIHAAQRWDPSQRDEILERAPRTTVAH